MHTTMHLAHSLPLTTRASTRRAPRSTWPSTSGRPRSCSPRASTTSSRRSTTPATTASASPRRRPATTPAPTRRSRTPSSSRRPPCRGRGRRGGAPRARALAGSRWMHVTAELEGTGLTALHGSSPDVGVVGYSLGGGIGWLARKHGLQANSVTAVELVTADGELVRADAQHNADLFWALRGGGGNFGVVTAIEFELYPVDEFYAGWLIFPWERSAEVLNDLERAAADAAGRDHLDRADPAAPAPPGDPGALRGAQIVVIEAAFLGSEEDGAELLARCASSARSSTPSRWCPRLGAARAAPGPARPVPGASTTMLLGDLTPRRSTRSSSRRPRLGLAVPVGRAAPPRRRARPPGPRRRRAGQLNGTFAMFAVGIPMDERSRRRCTHGERLLSRARRARPRPLPELHRGADGHPRRLLGGGLRPPPGGEGEVGRGRLFSANHPINAGGNR